MTLPSSCEGCPFYKYRSAPGNGFVPGKYVPGSKVLFYGQNPGGDEIQGRKLIKRHWFGGKSHDEFIQVEPQPLIGATGKYFEDRFLPYAGLTRGEISLDNAIRCRPGRGLGMAVNDLPPITSKMKLESSRADIVKALKFCRDTYLKVPSTVDTIVAMGRYAMFALTGIQNEENDYGHKTGVMESWRGFAVDVPSFGNFTTVDISAYHPLTSRYRIFFTLHIAALFEGMNKRFVHATLQDYDRLRRMREGKWPKPLPRYTVGPPQEWPQWAVFDTEYIPQLDDQLTSWSLCDTANNIHYVDVGDTRTRMYTLQVPATVLFQNVVTSADLRHLHTLVANPHLISLEDMMLAHSVLWPGEPHSLNYISSMFGSVNRYKHLSKDNPELYGALDAYEPWYMWKNHFVPSFRGDPQSEHVYRTYRLPLVSIIHKAQETGAKVDTSRLADIQAIYRARIAGYQARAVELTGKPIHLGGRTEMLRELYASVD